MTDVNIKWAEGWGTFSVIDSYGGYDVGAHDWDSAPIAEVVQFHQLLHEVRGAPQDDELNEIVTRIKEGDFDDEEHDDIEYLIHEAGIFTSEEGHFYGKSIEAQLESHHIIENEEWEAMLKLNPKIKKTLKKAGFELYRKVIEEI